jgi:hypothetical protein
MAVSLRKARDFVYGSGVLWERALFAYLFEGGSLDRLHQTLRCYRNPEGGWGHAIEPDVRTPESHPLALEFILGALIRDLDVPTGTLFEGASAWAEANREPDGSLRNPASVLDYPHAPWWDGGGQTMPDSITGNLTRIGQITPGLTASTRDWAARNLTLDQIEANDWLFMAYHAFDYFMNVADFPAIDDLRAATIRNIATCAEKMPEQQFYVLAQFAPTPESPVAQAIPALTRRTLDFLRESQQDDGGWNDEHGLPQWRPYVTILALRALTRHGRLALQNASVEHSQDQT